MRLQQGGTLSQGPLDLAATCLCHGRLGEAKEEGENPPQDVRLEKSCQVTLPHFSA